MKAQQNDNTLLDDKALVENLFNKQTLSQIEDAHKQVPNDFFVQQEQAILSAIRNESPKAKIISIGTWKKIAIAASFIAIAASAYIFIPSNYTTQEVANNVTIQEIPIAEIESYVNDYEAIAEIDWQSEINKEGSNLESISTYLKEDSNKTQE